MGSFQDSDDEWMQTKLEQPYPSRAPRRRKSASCWRYLASDGRTADSRPSASTLAGRIRSSICSTAGLITHLAGAARGAAELNGFDDHGHALRTGICFSHRGALQRAPVEGARC